MLGGMLFKFPWTEIHGMNHESLQTNASACAVGFEDLHYPGTNACDCHIHHFRISRFGQVAINHNGYVGLAWD